VNCRKVSHYLSAYMDGELPGVEHQIIHQHLSQCRECHAEYLGLLQVKRLLAGMRIQEPRAELPGMILQRVAAERNQPSGLSLAEWWRHFSLWWHQIAPPPPMVAFGAGLAAVGILWTLRMTDAPDGIQWTPASNVAMGLPFRPPKAVADLPLLPGVAASFNSSSQDFSPVTLENSPPMVFSNEGRPSRQQPGPSNFGPLFSPGRP